MFYKDCVFCSLMLGLTISGFVVLLAKANLRPQINSLHSAYFLHVWHAVVY